MIEIPHYMLPTYLTSAHDVQHLAKQQPGHPLLDEIEGSYIFIHRSGTVYAEIGNEVHEIGDCRDLKDILKVKNTLRDGKKMPLIQNLRIDCDYRVKQFPVPQGISLNFKRIDYEQLYYPDTAK